MPILVTLFCLLVVPGWLADELKRGRHANSSDGASLRTTMIKRKIASAEALVQMTTVERELVALALEHSRTMKQDDPRLMSCDHRSSP